jgi:hypothetical protein
MFQLIGNANFAPNVPKIERKAVSLIMWHFVHPRRLFMSEDEKFYF